MKGVQLSVAGSAEIDGDRLMMLRSAVSNLLSNAVRHADLGRAAAVAITAEKHGTSVSVESTADGIDPAALPRLFARRGQSRQLRQAASELGVRHVTRR